MMGSGVSINKLPSATKRGSEEGQYAPSAEVLSRQALEDNFRHIKGQRFKEELKRQDSKKA